MSPLTAFALGTVIAALCCGTLAFREFRRRRQAEQRQRAGQQIAEKHQALLETAPDGFFRWEIISDKPDGGFLNGPATCSRRLAVLLKLQNGTAATFNEILDCFDPEASAQLAANVQTLREQGAPFDLKLTLKQEPAHRSNGNRHILVFGSRTAGIDGQAFADVIWMRPSTEPLAPAQPEPVPLEPAAAKPVEADPAPIPKARTEPLTEQPPPDTFHEHVFNAALNSIGTPLAIFNHDAALEYFNDSYAAFWDLPADWLKTHPSINQVLDALRERRLLPEVANFVTYKDEQRALFGQLKEPKEILIHQPNGTTVKNTINPTDNGGLVFSYEDVTGHLALERSVNALTAVQRETLDHLHEGIAVFGSDGRLKLCNPMFASLWPITPEQRETEPHISDIIDLFQTSPGGQPLEAAEKERQIAHLLSRESDARRIPGRNGKILDYTKVPLPDGAVLLSYLDVTDSARVEEALTQKAAALGEANQLKSAFIANVSYEVQTPLKAVLGFTEILADEYYGALSPRQKEYIENIRETAQGLSTIVTDILDLASIEAGLMTLDLDSIDIHAMMVSVLNLIRENARHKHIKIEFDCAPDIGWMAADERRLKQVLFNLLTNAVQFTPAHGTVALKANRNGNNIQFIVADTGSGIPQADQERVFSTFERAVPVDEDQSQQGAGLGLSLVKNFVELHGGTVDLKSRPGRGTTFICRLPDTGQQSEQRA